MFALSPCLDRLLASLPRRPISKESFDKAVANALNESKDLSAESRKSQWEFLLKNKVFELAANEGAALDNSQTTYYDDLRDILDIVLSFTEHNACEQTLPFTVLQDLLESQTIASCSHVFSWIEERSERLTEGMVPQKGKALVLLRTLNDLLRRLSKTGNTTMFCGRILIFLSGVFPLGERSGVNLRGEYGPQWEGVTYDKGVETKEDEMDVDQSNGTQGPVNSVNEHKADEKESEKKSVKIPERTEEVKRRDFFNTFWSLQLYFSRPPTLSQPASFASFRSAVNSVMPVIKEATVKERAMMGSKAVVGNLKRKREEVPSISADESAKNYFFAKFLTSPDLLDLELSDTLFRRQFLFQLLILLSHLLQFSKAEKAKWATSRNRSLQMDFTLEPDDAKWVTETIARVYDEIRQTTPNGRGFAETVQTILEREKNWVKWKINLCGPFDKAPLAESIFDKTEPERKKMREDPPEWEHKLGSAALTEIWAMGYRDLYDLQTPFKPGEVKDFVRDIERENGRITLRKQQLAKQAQRTNEARARAAALKQASATTQQAAPAAAPSAPSTNLPVPETTPVPSTPRPTPAAAAASPLHPSLPAKPVSASDARPSTPMVKPVPAPAPNPPPLSLPPAETKPVLAPAPAPAVVTTTVEPTDPLIMKAEDAKQRISWLALRMARDEYLHHFGKIGTGDVVLLLREIEAEKERSQKGDVAMVTGTGSERGISPSVSGTVADKTAVKSEAEDVSDAVDAGVPPKETESNVKSEPSRTVEMQVDT